MAKITKQMQDELAAKHNSQLQRAISNLFDLKSTIDTLAGRHDSDLRGVLKCLRNGMKELIEGSDIYTEAAAQLFAGLNQQAEGPMGYTDKAYTNEVGYTGRDY